MTAISQKVAKNPSLRLESIFRGRDSNIAENYDNVNTIPTQHLLAQSYTWATVSVNIYCSMLVKHLCEQIWYMFTTCSSHII